LYCFYYLILFFVTNQTQTNSFDYNRISRLCVCRDLAISHVVKDKSLAVSGERNVLGLIEIV